MEAAPSPAIAGDRGLRDEGQEEQFSTQEVFESAVSIVRNLPKEGAIKPSDELRLKLYAYYKQASHGPNDTPKPRFYQLVELYKWDAWRKLGSMGREEAMLAYIGELKKIMDSIPADESSEASVMGPEFEEALGKKFYDYWFKHWKQSNGRKGLTQATWQLPQQQPPQATSTTTTASDTQGGCNSSSDNSSVSLLLEGCGGGDDDEDGYGTPTSLATAAGFESLIVGDKAASDQYAAAILRLQKGLEETNLRLSLIESRINQQPATSNTLSNPARGREPAPTGGSSLLINLLNSLKSVHWFYLSYPILIYLVMRHLENRRKRSCDARNLPR